MGWNLGQIEMRHQAECTRNRSEGDVYALSLRWECQPMLRKKLNEEAGRKSNEVRGDVASWSEQRVEEEQVSVRLETLNLSNEEMGEQGAGRAG